jgi:predicted GIY-YIG superfamily endonuclease
VAYVYILRGTTARYYIGVTDNLVRRLNEHNRGNNHTTRRLGGPLQLVCTHEMATIEAARVLERRLKRLKNPTLAIGAVQKLNGEPSSPE